MQSSANQATHPLNVYTCAASQKCNRMTTQVERTGFLKLCCCHTHDVLNNRFHLLRLELRRLSYRSIAQSRVLARSPARSLSLSLSLSVSLCRSLLFSSWRSTSPACSPARSLARSIARSLPHPTTNPPTPGPPGARSATACDESCRLWPASDQLTHSHDITSHLRRVPAA